jgi:hypothetical protein
MLKYSNLTGWWKLIFISIVLWGCSTNRLQSVKSNSFEGKIDKIYIIMKANKRSVAYFESLSDQFIKGFTSKGIKVETYIDKPLQLVSENEIDNRITNSDTNYIMFIQQTSSVVQSSYGYINNNNTSISAEMDIKIFYRDGSDKPIWRSSLTVKQNSLAFVNANLEGTTRVSVKSILEKLKDDGLL